MTKPPIAPRHSHVSTLHGHERQDPYAWLRDDNWRAIVAGDRTFANPEVAAYLQAEVAYTKAMTANQEGLRRTIYAEILGRIKEDKTSCPFAKGDYYYYRREVKGSNYPLYCRKYQSLSAPEEVYFDVNAEAAHHALFSMRAAATNPSGDVFAYAYNLTGSLEATIAFRDLTTGTDLATEITGTNGYFEWLNDDQLYFVERDDRGRGKNVYLWDRHRPDQRQLVFTKPADCDDMYLGIGMTTDRQFITLNLHSGSTQIKYVAANDGGHKFHLLARGDDDITFTIDHHKGRFYVCTNDAGAADFQILSCPADHRYFGREHWRTLIPEEPGLCLEDVHAYGHYLVIEAKNTQEALNELVVLDLTTMSRNQVAMPDEAYALDFWGAWDPNSTTVDISYTTPTISQQVYSLELSNQQLTLRYEEPTPNFDGDQYTVKRRQVRARDGSLVPVTIVHRRDLVLDGNNPAFVYGYGAYGHGMAAHFSRGVLSLIDRGFVYAIAHIRGGDDRGYQWYLDGKMQQKKNTFYDFLDCCQYLVDENYTRRGHITANGGSAGGLLMGAVTNMDPGMFRCVVADVAFVDVVNTICDASLPLTPPEWEEWGNPITSAEDYHYMLSYSPYDNVSAQDYPAMLFNSGISDEQVTYWEPTKMVAKLRHMKTDNNLVLLNMRMESGHAGASKRYEWIEESAFDYAFILSQYD